MNVGGLDRSTQDLILTVTLGTAAKLTNHEHGPVRYVESKTDLKKVVDRFLDPSADLPELLAGGTASNALYTMGLIQKGLARPFALHCFGTMGKHDSRHPQQPIDSLRRVGILPFCWKHSSHDATAVCVVARETGATASVVVYRGVKLHAPDSWPTMDVLVAGLDGLLHADSSVLPWVERSEALALLVDTSWDGQGLDLLVRLASPGLLRWIFGRASDLSRLGALTDGEPHPVLQAVEIVATNAEEPVAVWDPLDRRLVRLPVPKRSVDGDDLGAGDAYAGAYLYSRLSGKAVAVAHRTGAGWASHVLGFRGARPPPPHDLNMVFGPLIDRASHRSDEADIFDRIRLTHGLTALSGGQTGVDQIGLRVACRLGLAAFAVLPEGRRTEAADRGERQANPWSTAYVTEVGSPSYRYRTWANAYFGDGTLIWDLHGGDGSAATREACRALGRPFLDLAGTASRGTLSLVAEWAQLHQVRVVNVAGSRGSSLSGTEQEEVDLQIDTLLRRLASDWARLNSRLPERANQGPGPEEGGPKVALRVGVPEAPDYRALLGRFLNERFGVPVRGTRVLHVRHSALEVAYARARDLPFLLRSSAVDVILCGRDLLEDANVSARILLDTGLFCQLLGLIGSPSSMPANSDQEGIRLLSQYRRLARRLFRSAGLSGSFIGISGSAEAWIALGIADMAIDTWRTGRTAEANSLTLLKALGSTSLVLAASRVGSRERWGAIMGFTRELRQWLRSEEAVGAPPTESTGSEGRSNPKHKPPR